MKTKLLFLIFSLAILVFNSEFAQGANYYWVGNSGNWSDYANHWATTSGGNAFQTHVPTSFDNVYFDVNSFTASGQIVTIDTTITYCQDMDWTGTTNNPVLEAATSGMELKIFGSLTLNPVVNFSFNGQLTFTSVNPGKTIQTFSHILHSPIEFNGPGGEWTLLDSLTTLNPITLTYGTLRTNGNDITALSFESYNTNVRDLHLGTSTVTLTTLATAWNVSQSIVLDADSSIIRCTDDAVFDSEGHVYNTLEFDLTSVLSNYTGTIGGSNLRFNKIIYNNFFSYAELQVFCGNSWVDTIITHSSFQSHFGTSNFFNYVSIDHNCDLFTDVGAPALGDSIMYLIVNGNTGIGCNSSISSPNHHIHSFLGYGDLTIGGGLQTFDSCYVGGNATILSPNNQIGVFTVSGNATILSPNNHLGVFTMTPGKTMTLENDSTQYIDSLSATGNPGFPIQIVSSDLGLAANVFIQKSLCTDYLYIQAVHAASPNLLYVGANSNNVANNSGWIFTACLPTDIEENYDNELALYPNPATNQLSLTNSQLSIKEIEIYNTVGEKVLSQKPTAKNQQQINVSELAPGIYFVKLKNGQQEYVTKFVKE